MAIVFRNREDAINFIYADFLVLVEEKNVIFHIIFLLEIIDVLFNNPAVKILINFYLFVLFNSITDLPIMRCR